MREHLVLLAKIYVQPVRAMSAILDHGNWILGVASALILSFALSHFYHGIGVPSVTVALTVFGLFVPLSIVFIVLFERLGRIGTVVSRDLAPLLACCSLAWVAAGIPFAIFFPVSGPLPVVQLVCALYFLLLSTCALTVVFGAGYLTAAGAVILAAIVTAIIITTGVVSMLVGVAASPLFLIYAYWYFSGSFRSLGDGFRSRQAFRRSLEAAAINPHDADAQCQLGLIYQARRQYDQATVRFRRAISIDANEPEAHLQLGRILRDRGQLAEALSHFQAVVKVDPKYSSHDAWRDAGSVYVGMGRFNDALPVLEHYVSHRPYDPEGLFYLGRTYENLGRIAEARDAYNRAIEAATTAPPHRRRFVSRWGREAQRRFRDLKQ